MNDDEFLVLNAVYLRKLADAQVLVDVTGLDRATAVERADRAAGADLVLDVGESNYMLTDEGTRAVLAAYADRYADLRSEPGVEDWYQRFETVNGQFLVTLSAWQTSQDDAQLSKLLRLVERHIKALRAFTNTIARYARYADRLSAALDRIDRGETAFITSPTVDSVHNIWFEFHEDILTVLGRPRDVAEAEAAR